MKENVTTMIITNNTVDNAITSMQIAEMTGKRHDNIIRDIKDEIEKLENGGLRGDLKFELSSYITLCL